MSLMRRNIIAWLLILLASVLFVFAYISPETLSAYGYPEESSTESTVIGERVRVTGAATTPAVYYETESIFETSEESYAAVSDTLAETDSADPEREPHVYYLLSYFMYIAGGISAFASLFIIWQKNAVLGPDISFAGIAVYLYVLKRIRFSYLPTVYKIALTFVLLFIIRELWGWIRSKFALEWCASYRIAKKIPSPQPSMTVLVAWVVFTAVCAVLSAVGEFGSIPAAVVFAVSGLFGMFSIWEWGNDIAHFGKQLENFGRGEKISVKDGMLGKSEAMLKEVQTQHEQAVQDAVKSERFKVELITNISHDLRTPLTSILGYSELLQNEEMSEEGRDRLLRMYKKAGYMSDLVESLFELTKVSSGVIESKPEEIDLVKLIEQTLGLFDDQLTGAGLTVKRNYSSASAILVTDGAMMYRVFANIIGNAIKYALKGTRIYIEIKENEDKWTVRTVNTSSYEMDFDEDEIMQRFARGDKARTTKGSGLGLAIAQTYTEAVGGKFKIRVDGDQFNAMVELAKNLRKT